ncbi:MAG: tellurite resistance TerB family protein [Hyphomicrobium sp.]
MSESMSDRVSPPAALIYAMVTVSAADRTISTDELTRIGSIVRELPPFETYTEDWLADAAQECGRILRQEGGIGRVLDVIAASLPQRLTETAYALAAEVAASDLALHDTERQFLGLLAAKLRLDRDTCAALERGARARHQRA